MKTFIIACLNLFTAVLNSGDITAQETKVNVKSENRSEKINALIAAYSANGKFNGTVLVAEADKVIYKKAYGNAVFEWNVANTTDTRFEIGSLSKQFTALLVLQLAQEGKININDKISQYLTDIPADKSNITIHQLLLHTSGLLHGRDMEDGDNLFRKSYTSDEFFNLYINLPLKFVPGSDYHYSVFGYHLLSRLIEKLENKNLAEVYNERIFQPSRMLHSTTTDVREVQNKLASGYSLNLAFEPAHYRDPSTLPGAGSIITTVEDYFLYHKALQKNLLLNAEYMKRFTAAYRGDDGYSWVIYKYFNKEKKDTSKMVWFSGQVPGFNSVAYHCLDDDKLIVLFTNVQNQYLNEIADNILYILFGLPYTQPKKSIVEFISSQYRKNGIISAIKTFISLPSAEKKKYDNNIDEINRLAYNLLNCNEIKNAVEIFRLNVLLNPNCADCYDSLGEGYYRAGDLKSSLVNYSKAFDMDPKNMNAKKMIDKINSELK